MTYAVLVIDMFHYGEPEEHSVVHGFPTDEAAAEYARARTWDSVEEQRKPAQTHDELRDLWFMFGEDVVVLDGSYTGYDEIDYFVDHVATPSQREWWSLTPSAFTTDRATT